MPKFDHKVGGAADPNGPQRKKEPPKIEEVTRDFGLAHADKTDAEKRMAKNRALFFDLIDIPESELARQTIFVAVEDCPDPEQHVATLYPKWRVVKATKIFVDDEGTGEDAEWRIIIQEDPTKKSFQYLNPLDKKVYARSVAESAPQIDMETLEKKDPYLWQTITFQPPLPPRELKPLDDLDEDEKAALMKFLKPVKLTNTMQKPRAAKPEELENLESDDSGPVKDR